MYETADAPIPTDVPATVSAEQVYHCTEDGAHKFWRVRVEGDTLTVRWGRIGTAGQSLVKTFADVDAARAEAERQAAGKRTRGYVAVSAEEADAAAPAPVAAAGRRRGADIPAGQLAFPWDDAPSTPVLVRPPPPPAEDARTLSLF